MISPPPWLPLSLSTGFRTPGRRMSVRVLFVELKLGAA